MENLVRNEINLVSGGKRKTDIYTEVNWITFKHKNEKLIAQIECALNNITNYEYADCDDVLDFLRNRLFGNISDNSISIEGKQGNYTMEFHTGRLQ